MHEEVIDLFNLKGQVAVVTGGARHLGFDGACILAAAGCDVVVTSRSLGSAEDAASRIKEKYGVDALGLELDQTDYDDIVKVGRQAGDWKQQLDILVNNAGGGVGSVALLFERDPKDVAEMISLNLTGALYCCREMGKSMAERGRGKIINIASVAGMIGRDRRMYERCEMAGQPIDYAAAKAGVIGMTRDMAGYLSPMGVCVNTISPGGFQRDLSAAFVTEFSEGTPMGRMGRDGIDLKGAILFLASPASDYVTGINLAVDGGFSIWH